MRTTLSIKFKKKEQNTLSTKLKKTRSQKANFKTFLLFFIFINSRLFWRVVKVVLPAVFVVFVVCDNWKTVPSEYVYTGRSAKTWLCLLSLSLSLSLVLSFSLSLSLSIYLSLSLLSEVKLSYDTVCPSVRWSVDHNFLKVH